MADGSLRQYDPLSGRDLGSWRAHQTPVRRVAISDDGKSGASTAEDSAIRIWDLETRAERASIPQHVPTTDLRFVGNEEILFSLKLGNQKHILCVRSVLEDKNAFAVGIPGDRLSNSLFLPEQRHVLAGVPDGSVKIWQLPYQNERRQIYTRLEAIEQIALSPDGKYLIAYGECDIQIRRFDNAHGAGRYSVPIDGHAPVVLSEDGRYILSADGKGTIHVWGLPGPIDDDVVGESFTVHLHDWHRAEDYQKLEDTADTLRKQQLYLPWGDSYLHNFYSALGMSTASDVAKQRKYESLLDAWRKQFPDSVTPRTLQARWLIQRAWQARGSGFAYTVTPEGSAQFNRWIQEAEETLAPFEKIPHKDSEAYTLMIDIAKAQGWSRPRVEAVIEKCLEVDPRFFPIYHAVGEYLLPRWRGEPGEFLEWIEGSADRLGGDAGENLYCILLSSLYRYYGGAFHKATGLSYERIKEGLMLSLAEFPGQWRFLNQLGFLAAMNHDYPLAHDCFKRIGAAFDPVVWRAKGNYNALRSRKPPGRVSPERKRFLGAHLFSVTSLAFADDGQILITTTNEAGRRSIALWNPRDGSTLGQLPHPMGVIVSCAVSPDGRFLAVAGNPKGDWPGVTLWDLTTGGAGVLEGHSDRVHAVRFSPEGRQLATASADKTAILRSLEDPDTRLTLRHNGKVQSLAFSPDGKLLATGAAGEVRLWDPQSGNSEATFSIGDAHGYSVAFSPDGATLAAAASDGSIHLWDVDTKKELASLRVPKTRAFSVAFSPDGKLLAAAGSDSNVWIWQVGSEKEPHKLEGHWGAVNEVVFSPDGKELASGSRDGSVLFWDATALAR